MGGELGRVFGADPRAARVLQHHGRAHHRRGYDRQPQRHRFDQYQALGFGRRGEDENVAGTIAVQQFGAPVQVAEEGQVAFQAKAGAELFQARGIRAFASDHEQQVRKFRDQALGDVDQETDVLFARKPADRHQYRAPRMDAVPAPERHPGATLELVQVDACRQDGHCRADAIAFHHLDHLLRRHDQVVHLVAQATRREPRERTQQACWQPGQVESDVFFEVRVVGLHRRAADDLRQAHAQRVRAKWGVDVDDIPVAQGQPRQSAAQGRSLDQPVFRIEEDLA